MKIVTKTVSKIVMIIISKLFEEYSNLDVLQSSEYA